jgi:hypothetical protein
MVNTLMKSILNCSLLLLLGGAFSATADTWTFALTPGTVITGTAAATIGWGYTITNNSATEWLVIENLTETPFQNVSSLDSVFDYPILAPGTTAAESYVQGSSGLLGLTWSASAPAYFVNTGNFVIAADWYNGDPGGGGTDLGAAAQETVAYTAQVAPSSTTSTSPEPSSIFLWSMSLTALAMFNRRRKLNPLC